MNGIHALLRGVARLVDPRGTLSRPSRAAMLRRNSRCTDYEALCRDWDDVGNDLRLAIRMYQDVGVRDD